MDTSSATGNGYLSGPERIAGAVLAVVALLYGLYNGAPWMGKEMVATRLAEHDRSIGRLERADEQSVAERRLLQTELTRLGEQLRVVDERQHAVIQELAALGRKVR